MGLAVWRGGGQTRPCTWTGSCKPSKSGSAGWPGGRNEERRADLHVEADGVPVRMAAAISEGGTVPEACLHAVTWAHRAASLRVRP